MGPPDHQFIDDLILILIDLIACETAIAFAVNFGAGAGDIVGAITPAFTKFVCFDGSLFEIFLSFGVDIFRDVVEGVGLFLVVFVDVFELNDFVVGVENLHFDFFVI